MTGPLPPVSRRLWTLAAMAMGLSVVWWPVAAADLGIPSMEETLERAEEYRHLLPSREEMTTPEDLDVYLDMSREIFRESAEKTLKEINRRAVGLGLDPDPDPALSAPRELPDRYRATVLVSYAMGEERLRDLFARYQGRGDVRFVFRGVPPEMTVPQFAMLLQDMVPTKGAQLLIDPEIFASVAAVVAPTIVLEDRTTRGALGPGTDMGAVVAVATGLSNPDYVFERFEAGVIDLSQPTSVAIVEEDLIVRAKREAAAVHAGLERDPEVIRDRFWTRQVKGLDAAPITPAPATRHRQLHFAWVAPETIHDAEGRIIAHQGKVFMPQDVLPFDRQIFVFDPSSDAELDFVRERVSEPLPDGALVRVFIVTRLPAPEADDPPWQVLQDLVDEFRHPVYVLNENFRTSFKVEHTPTEIRPELIGSRVEVISSELAVR